MTQAAVPLADIAQFERANPEVLFAADPYAAFDQFRRDMAEVHGADWDEVVEHLPLALLEGALVKRRTMEAHWPDAPASCHIYACWNRPASEYYLPLPVGAQVRNQQADWAAWVPWSYVASPEPLTWPDVQLLRQPLETA